MTNSDPFSESLWHRTRSTNGTLEARNVYFTEFRVCAKQRRQIPAASQSTLTVE